MLFKFKIWFQWHPYRRRKFAEVSKNKITPSKANSFINLNRGTSRAIFYYSYYYLDTKTMVCNRTVKLHTLL